MSTIALYANKLNRMPGLLNDVKNFVKDYKSELSALRTKSLTINKSVCNMDDVISFIQSSSQTQEQKIESLETCSQNSEQFVSDAARVDGNVADLVNRRKDDFYDKYNYLKPECEKNEWEKFCDGIKAVGEWCKDHWVMVGTILVVIAIAVLAVVTFGVALAVVAAIAGVVSMVLFAADVICMIATGGKNLTAVFREKGWNVLADIFGGLQVGCDIVAIIFPAAAAIKSMAKVGVKTFVKASFKAIPLAFKKCYEQVFKKGLKGGLTNSFEIIIKTFIFDIDDFTKVEKGKKVWNLMENTLNTRKAKKDWITDGGQLIPNPNTIPKKNNPNGLSMKGIMNSYNVDAIPLGKNGIPDLSGIAVAESGISMKNLDFDIEKALSKGMSEKKFGSTLRGFNYKNAEAALPEGITLKTLEEKFGFKISPHEDVNMKKVYYVPSQIHANLPHNGGIENYKKIFHRIPDIARLVGQKSTQWGFRFSIDMVTRAAAGN